MPTIRYREESEADERVQAAYAAIDRVVHHSVILEFSVPSFRSERAAAGDGGRVDDNYPKAPARKARGRGKSRK